ncbi:MAG: hypothetical protein PHH58_10645 [Rhodoferax sp.]|nr:hypothetical protein [Rhodoferax sp.]
MKSSWPQPIFAVVIALALLVMLALQGWVEYSVLAPVRTQVQQLQQEVAALRKTAGASAQPVSPPQARLKSILARLGQQPNTRTRVQRLHTIAAHNAVLVRKASYQNKIDSGAMARHEVHADLSGSYPAIRHFLRELMAQDEALALQSIELSRPVGSTGVRAQVRLVLFSNP